MSDVRRITGRRCDCNRQRPYDNISSCDVRCLTTTHRRRHHGAQRGTCPPLLICRRHGGTDNRYETFDTLVNWAIGSHLANKDTVM